VIQHLWVLNRVGFFLPLPNTEMNAMHDSPQTMAEQIAQVAAVFHQQSTGHEPKSVSVVVGGDTLVVTLHGALSAAELAMAQIPDGAAKVQEFHRQLFLNASATLRQEIKRITGLDVREAAAEVEPDCTVVKVFPSGVVVQIFLLSGNAPPGSFNGGDRKQSDGI
jgi:uncharacterized protein YbcI